MGAMGRQRLALSLILVVTEALNTLPARAEGPPVDQEMSVARALFEAGRDAFSEARYEEALEHFEAAYEQSGRPALLFNIGQCHDRLRQDQQAVDAFERYLQAQPQAANREAVENRLRTLREILARKQPSPGVSVPIATHGHVEPSPVRIDKSEPLASQSGWLAPVVTMSGGAALSVTGGILMGLAYAHGQEVEQAEAGSEYGALKSDLDRAERMWMAGQVLLGVGATALAGGLTWLVLTRRSQNTAVRASLTPAGLRIAGKF